MLTKEIWDWGWGSKFDLILGKKNRDENLNMIIRSFWCGFVLVWMFGPLKFGSQARRQPAMRTPSLPHGRGLKRQVCTPRVVKRECCKTCVQNRITSDAASRKTFVKKKNCGSSDALQRGKPTSQGRQILMPPNSFSDAWVGSPG